MDVFDYEELNNSLDDFVLPGLDRVTHAVTLFEPDRIEELYTMTMTMTMMMTMTIFYSIIDIQIEIIIYNSLENQIINIHLQL